MSKLMSVYGLMLEIERFDLLIDYLTFLQRQINGFIWFIVFDAKKECTVSFQIICTPILFTTHREKMITKILPICDPKSLLF